MICFHACGVGCRAALRWSSGSFRLTLPPFVFGRSGSRAVAGSRSGTGGASTSLAAHVAREPTTGRSSLVKNHGPSIWRSPSTTRHRALTDRTPDRSLPRQPNHVRRVAREADYSSCCSTTVFRSRCEEYGIYRLSHLMLYDRN